MVNNYFTIAQKNLENVGIKFDYETIKNMGMKQIINLLRNNKLPWRAGITKPILEKRKQHNRYRNSLTRK